jgi:hypothetical protein
MSEIAEMGACENDKRTDFIRLYLVLGPGILVFLVQEYRLRNARDPIYSVDLPHATLPTTHLENTILQR